MLMTHAFPTLPHAPRRPWLWVEFALLFVLAPALLVVIRNHLRFLILPLMAAAGLGFGLALLRQRGFDQQTFVTTRGLGRQLRSVLLVFIPGALVAMLAAYSSGPRFFLRFPLHRPLFWAVLMIVYPLMGALPQELMFRGFFFYRYGGLFPNRWVLLGVNATCFALFHVFFWNPFAPVLALAGGLLFGYRYLKTGSLLAVSVEHGLWGDLLFTVGLGRFLFSGGIH